MDVKVIGIAMFLMMSMQIVTVEAVSNDVSDDMLMEEMSIGNGPFKNSLGAKKDPILGNINPVKGFFYNTWYTIYGYTDEEIPAKVKDIGNDMTEVVRSYAWKGRFRSIYAGRVKIEEFESSKFETEEAREWTSPRISLVNPKNKLVRYEIRLYPETDKLQVNYVDRTNMTGDWELDAENTVSEVLTSTDCNIQSGEWYYTFISKTDKRWRAIVMDGNDPTCIVDWKDDRIKSNRYNMGIQSAGKYMVSRFDKFFGV